MSILEQLDGCLSKVVALVFVSSSHGWVLNCGYIEIAWLIDLVSDFAKCVQRVDSI